MRRHNCGRCGKRHGNQFSHTAHGLCTACRDEDLDATRATRRCCRCGTEVAPLTEYHAAKRDRFLGCPGCGLILSRDPDDVVIGYGSGGTQGACGRVA